jgi:hypothetical protein
VAAAFTALHDFIQAGGLAKQPGVIKTGDWIDLEGGLAVEAYRLFIGGFSHNAEAATQAVTLNGAAHGTLCRLIVAGVNSFNGINGNGTTPHVVFQFQNIPVKALINISSMVGSQYAYQDSDMRIYLNGYFRTGLKNAGVPEGVLWVPKRYIGNVNLQDSLWLPTEREMFQDGTSGGFGPYAITLEKAENQARLEYYTSDSTRQKVSSANAASPYWSSSRRDRRTDEFCIVSGGGYPGYSGSNGSGGSSQGVAPAFCVQ